MKFLSCRVKRTTLVEFNDKRYKIGAFKTLKCATCMRSGIFISVPQAVEPVSLIGAKLCVFWWEAHVREQVANRSVGTWQWNSWQSDLPTRDFSIAVPPPCISTSHYFDVRLSNLHASATTVTKQTACFYK